MHLDEFIASKKGRHVRTADVLRAIATSIREMPIGLSSTTRYRDRLAAKVERLADTVEHNEERAAA